MDLNVQQLRMLAEVSHRGTIASAATSLGYTPSAVSQQLGSLERTTGVAVLERVGRTVQLTDAGRELVHHAEVVLAQLEEAQAALERIQSDVTGDIRVGILESVAGTLLPIVLPRLREQHPDLTVRTFQSEAALELEAVRSGEIDAVFLIDYPRSPTDVGATLTRTPICQDWFRVIVPTDWDGPDQVSLADLQDEPIIASPPELSCGRCITLSFVEAGVTPDIVHQIDDYPTVLNLVAAGAGLGLVPELGVLNLPPGVRVIELAEPFARSVDLVCRTSSENRPAIRAFVEAVEFAADELKLDRP